MYINAQPCHCFVFLIIISNGSFNIYYDKLKLLLDIEILLILKFLGSVSFLLTHLVLLVFLQQQQKSLIYSLDLSLFGTVASLTISELPVRLSLLVYPLICQDFKYE